MLLEDIDGGVHCKTDAKKKKTRWGALEDGVPRHQQRRSRHSRLPFAQAAAVESTIRLHTFDDLQSNTWHCICPVSGSCVIKQKVLGFGLPSASFESR